MQTLKPVEFRPGDVIEFIDGYRDRFTVSHTEGPDFDADPESGPSGCVGWRIHGRTSQGYQRWFDCGKKSLHLVYERGVKLPRYRAHWTVKYKPRVGIDGPIEDTPQAALTHVPENAKVVTVLRDQQGRDHPANAGKFFLVWIIK